MVLYKIKKVIGIEKISNTNILTDTDDKLLDYITLKNVSILMACVIKNDGKCYLQIFSKKALFVK